MTIDIIDIMKRTGSDEMKTSRSGVSKAGVLALAAVFLGAAGLRAEDAKPPVPLTLSAPLTLSGYGQMEYISQETGLGGFSIHRMRLSLAGEILKGINFKVQVDAAKAAILLDAYADIGFHSAATVRLGQFKVPFSQESLASDPDVDTIDRSQVVNKLAPGFDIGTNGRDIGAMLSGKAAFLEYSLGVFNGSGINKADTDDKKDLAARLVIHPASILSLGVSAYNGQTVPSAGAVPVKRARLGLEMALLYQGFSFKGEFIQGQDGDTMRQGWYAQGGYFFLPKTLQGIVKFDSYDPNRNAALDRTDLWLFGLNWFLNGQTKLQVNYLWSRDETGHTVNRVLEAQFQAGF
jgi:phosphate-selective porin OprO/OprP